MQTWMYIGIGGFLGAVFRHIFSVSAHRLLPATAFPIGTLTVNVLGAFLIGLAAGLLQSRGNLSMEMRYFITTGFLGAFTTFSTFSLETFFLYRDQGILIAAGNILLQLLLGLTAVIGAFYIGRTL